MYTLTENQTQKYSEEMDFFIASAPKIKQNVNSTRGKSTVKFFLLAVCIGVEENIAWSMFSFTFMHRISNELLN